MHAPARESGVHEAPCLTCSLWYSIVALDGLLLINSSRGKPSRDSTGRTLLGGELCDATEEHRKGQPC